MRWLAVCHARLRHVGEGTTIYGLEFVALLLAFPVFKLHNLLFKISYTIQQRKLRNIGSECARLGGQDYSLQFDNLALDYGSIADTYHGLQDCYGGIEGRFKRSHGAKVYNHHITS